MGQVKAPDVPQPKRGLTDFERKIADILFAKMGTNELGVERVLDVAIAIGEGLMKDAVEASATDIRTYKEENEVDFTIMLEKGIIPYELEQEVKLIIIKEG